MNTISVYRTDLNWNEIYIFHIHEHIQYRLSLRIFTQCYRISKGPGTCISTSVLCNIKSCSPYNLLLQYTSLLQNVFWDFSVKRIIYININWVYHYIFCLSTRAYIQSIQLCIHPVHPPLRTSLPFNCDYPLSIQPYARFSVHVCIVLSVQSCWSFTRLTLHMSRPPKHVHIPYVHPYLSNRVCDPSIQPGLSSCIYDPNYTFQWLRFFGGWCWI